MMIEILFFFEALERFFCLAIFSFDLYSMIQNRRHSFSGVIGARLGSTKNKYFL